MTVNVRFIGSLRNAAGKSGITLQFKQAISLSEAIDRIIEKLPQLKRALIDPELCDPRPNTLILVNEKDISVLDGLNTMLRNGDEVVFVPVLHGG